MKAFIFIAIAHLLIGYVWSLYHEVEKYDLYMPNVHPNKVSKPYVYCLLGSNTWKTSRHAIKYLLDLRI